MRSRKNRLLSVCQKFFLNVLNIGRSRVHRICKQHFISGAIPIEKRGGDRSQEKFEGKRKSIEDFIKSFRTIELHYCRGTNSKRQYLPSQLSIATMWRQYQIVHPEIQVKESYFRMIFCTKFNLGFKTPSTDMCSTCLCFKEQIKLEKEIPKKNQLMVQNRVHKMRAKSFFEFLNETRDDLLTVSFDCQKNMVLPKIPDQAAYYSRQLYLYLFGMVVGTGHSKLTKDNVFLYHWTENVHRKGSNEIASAVFHRLCNLNLSGIITVRLVCDGCGGQNKNSIMVGMVSYWLATKAPLHIKCVELIFPVAGHSYIPPDRVFAQIEKKVKIKDTIVDVQEYLDIYSTFGTIVSMGDECSVYDFRKSVGDYLKPPGNWHFKFQESKRMIMTRNQKRQVSVRGEVFYKSDLGKPMSVMKKIRKFNH